jgi:hypothetical protein
LRKAILIMGLLVALVATGAVLASESRSSNEIPVAQCNDREDNDGDGLIDWGHDPGCSSLSDDDEYNAPAPPPPPQPPPPPPEEFGDFMVGYNYSTSETDECSQGPSYPCLKPSLPAAIRCKKVVNVQQFREGHFGVEMRDSMKYGVQWRVCYHPYGGGITEVTYRYGDVVDTNFPWEFRGNDSGFPYHIRQAHKVFIYYGFGVAECFTHIGCSNEHHGRLTYTFTDSGLYGSWYKVVNTIQ